MKASATCSKCGKSLSDPISISFRLGPVCRLNKKLENMNNGNLFASRAEYEYDIEGSILWIADKGGMKLVTNDIENILADIAKDQDISRKKIMYKDSDGIWDEIRATIATKKVEGKDVVSISNLEFLPITEKEFSKAKEKLLSK